MAYGVAKSVLRAHHRQAVHAEAFEATRAAQQAGLQQRMAQRAAMPGFTELQGLIRGWRDGHQKLKQGRKAMKRLLPEPAERESLLRLRRSGLLPT